LLVVGRAQEIYNSCDGNKDNGESAKKFFNTATTRSNSKPVKLRGKQVVLCCAAWVIQWCWSLLLRKRSGPGKTFFH